MSAFGGKADVIQGVGEGPLIAEAVEKLFGVLKSRPFGNERKFDSNKINSLGIQQFGNARRFRLKTGFSGVFQQPQPKADLSSAEGGGTLLAHDAAREAREDRRQGGQSWPVRHVPIGRGGSAEKLVPENLGPD